MYRSYYCIVMPRDLLMGLIKMLTKCPTLFVSIAQKRNEMQETSSCYATIECILFYSALSLSLCGSQSLSLDQLYCYALDVINQSITWFLFIKKMMREWNNYFFFLKNFCVHTITNESLRDIHKRSEMRKMDELVIFHGSNIRHSRQISRQCLQQSRSFFSL